MTYLFKYVVGLFLTCSLLFSNIAIANLVLGASYGVDSNFVNNGFITTEYRADGTVWEWLDLTFTNGIRFNSIQADIDDDGIINNSSPLSGGSEFLVDLASLTLEQTTGWSTVSETIIVNMANSFFGLTLSEEDVFEFNASVPIVDDFIQLFGETFYEAQLDLGNILNDVNPALPNLGVSIGMSNTFINADSVATLFVSDQQSNFSNEDIVDDVIRTDTGFAAASSGISTGTFLIRQAQPVPAPSSLIIFTSAFVGLMAYRKYFAA